MILSGSEITWFGLLFFPAIDKIHTVTVSGPLGTEAGKEEAGNPAWCSSAKVVRTLYPKKLGHRAIEFVQ